MYISITHLISFICDSVGTITRLVHTVAIHCNVAIYCNCEPLSVVIYPMFVFRHSIGLVFSCYWRFGHVKTRDQDYVGGQTLQMVPPG